MKHLDFLTYNVNRTLKIAITQSERPRPIALSLELQDDEETRDSAPVKHACNNALKLTHDL